MSAAAPRCGDARVQRVVDLFEHLAPADVARLGDFYAADARFKDPFNEVQGVAAVQAVFESGIAMMLAAVERGAMEAATTPAATPARRPAW